jgi:hypothetical protein
MTKANFEPVALALRVSRPKNTMDTKKEYQQWSRTVDSVCNVFSANYPRFDSFKFQKACND